MWKWDHVDKLKVIWFFKKLTAPKKPWHFSLKSDIRKDFFPLTDLFQLLSTFSIIQVSNVVQQKHLSIIFCHDHRAAFNIVFLRSFLMISIFVFVNFVTKSTYPRTCTNATSNHWTFEIFEESLWEDLIEWKAHNSIKIQGINLSLWLWFSVEISTHTICKIFMRIPEV